LWALVLPSLSLAAILPDSVGAFQRGAVSQPALADRAVWDEYGLKASESAVYDNGDNKFTVTAYQLQDSTGALAAFDWQRPPDARPSTAAKLAAETPGALILQHGNYLLILSGYKPAAFKPTTVELEALTGALRNVDPTALPTLPGYLPSGDLVANSERYVIGPISLQKFAPGISPSAAAFHTGAEAQVGVFHSPKGDLNLAIFRYPTPQLAATKVVDFDKLPGAVVKRSGPLVAVILSPPDPDFAERVLGQVRYQADVTENEYVPGPRDNMGLVIINCFIFIGILVAFAILSGLFMGGFRSLRRRGHHGADADAMIELHLEQR
jgi:hypothetical protein